MMYWCHVWHLWCKVPGCSRKTCLEAKQFPVDVILNFLLKFTNRSYLRYHFHTHYTLSNASTSICLLIFQTWMTPSVKTMTPWGRSSITSWRMKVCVWYAGLTKAFFFFFTVINVTFNCTLHTFSTLFHPPSMKWWQLALHCCSSRHTVTHYPGRKCLSV